MQPPATVQRRFAPESAAVACKRCIFARKLLPSNHRNIDVPRIDIDTATDAFSELSSHHGCARAEKRIIDCVASLRVVQDWSPHQLNRLLGSVTGRFLVAVAAHWI